MSNQEVELNLLNDYLNAALKAEDQADANKQLTLYERQLALCKNQGLAFNVHWCEAMVYYIRAVQKLNTQGFTEKVLRDTARQSSGFDGLLPAIAAKERESSRAREVIVLLDQAINIYRDDADFWFMRAELHKALNNKKDAQYNVDYILSTFRNDEKLYYEARKLKDEIESMQTGDGKCFIATAVYEDLGSFELVVLRDFRDEVLLQSSVGRTAVSCYYAVSPSIARWLRRSDAARLLVRLVVLDPIVRFINRREMQG